LFNTSVLFAFLSAINVSTRGGRELILDFAAELRGLCSSQRWSVLVGSET